MALIIEDGTIVTGANTYLNVAEAMAILVDLFGIVPSPALSEKDLKAATRYLESFGNQYKGAKVSANTQSLQFPRQGVVIDCILQPSDVIPTTLKNAQAFAAYEESLGNTLQPTNTGQETIAKSIAGQISVNKTQTGISGLKFTQVNQYLKPLFNKQNAMTRVTRS